MARSRRAGSRGRVTTGVTGGSAYARGGSGEPGQTRRRAAGTGRDGRRPMGAGQLALRAARRRERAAGAGVGWGRGRPGLRAAAGASVRQRWWRPGSGAVERERKRERKGGPICKTKARRQDLRRRGACQVTATSAPSSRPRRQNL